MRQLLIKCNAHAGNGRCTYFAARHVAALNSGADFRTAGGCRGDDDTVRGLRQVLAGLVASGPFPADGRPLFVCAQDVADQLAAAVDAPPAADP